MAKKSTFINKLTLFYNYYISTISTNSILNYLNWELLKFTSKVEEKSMKELIIKLR